MTVYVNTPDKGKLNMRAEPTTSSKVLTQIPYNTSLEIEYINNDWSKTGYDGKIGYVMTKFLDTNKAITKNDLKTIYNSLKNTLEIIEKILK